MDYLKKPLFTLLAAISLGASATDKPLNDLENEILAMDKRLFDAFNTCDLGIMSDILDQDLEFYHDKSGLTDHSQTMTSSENNCKAKLGLTRTLLPEFTAIFPINKYGAIQEGRHQFCHLANGKKDCGIFKFVHIWKLHDQQWTITRVVSYDH